MVQGPWHAAAPGIVHLAHQTHGKATSEPDSNTSPKASEPCKVAHVHILGDCMQQPPRVTGRHLRLATLMFSLPVFATGLLHRTAPPAAGLSTYDQLPPQASGISFLTWSGGPTQGRCYTCGVLGILRIRCSPLVFVSVCALVFGSRAGRPKARMVAQVSHRAVGSAACHGDCQSVYAILGHAAGLPRLPVDCDGLPDLRDGALGSGVRGQMAAADGRRIAACPVNVTLHFTTDRWESWGRGKPRRFGGWLYRHGRLPAPCGKTTNTNFRVANDHSSSPPR